jgi:transcription elongation GreA/GreB family factor
MFADVLRLAREARRDGRAIPGISEIEVHVLEVIGDLRAAERLLVDLWELSPRDIEVRLQLLSVRLRMDKRDAAADLVLAITDAELDDNPEHLMAVAEARQFLELPGALEFAYRARRAGFNTPDIHQRYLSLFLNRERVDEQLLTPTEVQVDSAVQLKRDAEEIVITIIAEDDVSRSRGEIGPGEDLATKLLGLKVGAKVRVGPEPGALEYTIETIQSKYVSAFQQTLLEFPIWFPNEPDFRRVEINSNDLSNVFLVIDERHRVAQQVMDLYQAKPITLGVLARLLGRSVVDVWTGLVGIKGQRLYASVGTEAEATQDARAIRATSAIALDVVALLTFAHLGFLDRLPASFDRLFVAQSVVDHFRLHYLRNFTGATPSGLLGKEGPRYVSGDITEEDIEKGRAFMKGILGFLDTQVEIMPVSAALSLGPGEYSKLQGSLGGESIDAILVALGTNALLVTDDLRLRQLATASFRVEGVWSLPVLADLMRRGTLSADEYWKAKLALLLSNYRHPRMATDDLFRLLEESGFRLTPEVEALLRASLGPDYGDQSVVAVAAELVKNLWRQQILEQQREALVGAVLASVIQPRSGRRQILMNLTETLRDRFRLDPLGFRRLAEFLQAWATAHYI